MADYECHNIFPSSEYCFILSQNTAYRYDFIYFKNIPLYIYHINILFYHSQKYKLITLCIAMGMSVKETDRALLLANQPKLSPKIQKDAALIICINHKYRSVYKVNEFLMDATLSSGRTTQGAIYYEVPENAQTIELEYDINYFSSNKIIFMGK